MRASLLDRCGEAKEERNEEGGWERGFFRAWRGGEGSRSFIIRNISWGVGFPRVPAASRQLGGALCLKKLRPFFPSIFFFPFRCATPHRSRWGREPWWYHGKKEREKKKEKKKKKKKKRKERRKEGKEVLDFLKVSTKLKKKRKEKKSFLVPAVWKIFWRSVGHSPARQCQERKKERKKERIPFHITDEKVAMPPSQGSVILVLVRFLCLAPSLENGRWSMLT